jgi:hypothetical protein
MGCSDERSELFPNGCKKNNESNSDNKPESKLTGKRQEAFRKEFLIHFPDFVGAAPPPNKLVSRWLSFSEAKSHDNIAVDTEQRYQDEDRKYNCKHM